MRQTACAAIAITILCVCCASAATWVVDVSGGGDFITIQAGVTAAVGGDTVLVMPGTYAGAGNRDIDFLGKNLLLRSTGGPEVTEIDCGSYTRALYLHSGEGSDATVEGLTIRNGRAYEGAGIYVTNDSSLTITNCVIEDCSTTFDSWAGGGGVYCDLNSNAYMYGCAIRGNITGAYGGGVAFTGGSQSVVQDCVFEGNYGGINAGGIHVRSGSYATISRTVFIDNYAGSYGGGIHVSMASANIEDCTFYDNWADGSGGGISCQESSPTITRTVISHSYGGGAIACVLFGPSDPQIWNCNIFGNNGGDTLCGTHWDNLFVDPLYCDEASGDLSLCADSQCLAAGNAWGVDMGGLGQGCTECGTGLPAEEASWAVIKSLYR